MCDNILIMQQNSMIPLGSTLGLITGKSQRAAQRCNGKLGRINRARKKLKLPEINPKSSQEEQRRATNLVLCEPKGSREKRRLERNELNEAQTTLDKIISSFFTNPR